VSFFSKKNIHPLTRKTMGEELRKLKNKKHDKENHKIDREGAKRND
jgi:hypothetical protein